MMRLQRSFVRPNIINDARGWLSVIMQTIPQEQVTRVVVRLWVIWYARRQVIHENKFQSRLSTNCFVERFISELGMIKKPVREQNRQRSRPTTRPQWIPPPSDMTKVNVDATLSKNSGICSVTAIARDGEGHFLGASAFVLDGCFDPETVEAMTCIEGLALAADLMLQKLRLAMDCASVVKSIAGEGMRIYGQIIQEVKARRNDFTRVEFVHEHRDSNRDAHVIARSSIYKSLGRHVWLLTPPTEVCNLIPLVNQ
jgi:ribonuclease HI